MMSRGTVGGLREEGRSLRYGWGEGQSRQIRLGRAKIPSVRLGRKIPPDTVGWEGRSLQVRLGGRDDPSGTVGGTFLGKKTGFSPNPTVS